MRVNPKSVLRTLDLLHLAEWLGGHVHKLVCWIISLTL
jgi:hypothetical protein